MNIITLSRLDSGLTLTLPEDLVWIDELTWSGVSQATERGITGKLIVDAMARVGGRTITLQGEGNTAWISRGTVRQIREWADTPGLRMALWLHSQEFIVVFDHGTEDESRAMGMAAVIEFSDKVDSDYYCSLRLRFITRED